MSAKKPIPPHFRCDYDLPTAAAIQALIKGEASPEQQRGAMNWIINQAAATYNTSFSELGDRETAFAEGRRFVGTNIVKLNTLSLNALRKAQND
jgi:hypothetical protein